MKRLLGFTLGLVLVWMSWGMVSEPAIAAPAPAVVTTYTYDGSHSLSATTDNTPECGPPSYARAVATAHDAADRWSHGASACSVEPTPGDVTANDDPTALVQVVLATDTTAEQVRHRDWEVSSRVQGRVAAKAGREIPFGPASEDAWSVLNRVDGKGAPLPGYKGGKTFLNDGSQGAARLPERPTYREWDLSPNVKGVPRDARRLVTGSDGSAFYTTDHYLSFIQFR